MGEASAGTDGMPKEGTESSNVVTFGRQGGCYVTKGVAALLAILFLSALVATGVLVYYFVPQVRETRHDNLSSAPTTNAKDTPESSPIIGTTSVAPLREPPVAIVATAATPVASSTTTVAPKERPNVRLPRALKPLHYVIKLQPFVNGNSSIVGYVEVEMEVLEATSNITLHIDSILTKNETVKVSSKDQHPGERTVAVTSHAYDPERQFYVAGLAQPLQPGKNYILSMEFVAHLNDHLNGFFKLSYRDVAGIERWAAMTIFQATAARRAFPCFDEPGLKATFEIYLAREENMSSISNMPIMESLPVEGQKGWMWDHYYTSVPMSTYLVAFVVSDFTHVNSTAIDHVLYRVWAREEAIGQANYSLEIGPEMLVFYEYYFGIPFPLPKLDSIAVPESIGGMENWGLITYGESLLLYEEGVSAAANKQRVGFFLSHELAHQWFGNLVTPRWWSDLWLNEGFASFMEYLALDHAEPTWKVMEQFVVMDLQNVFTPDGLESSHPISIPVEHPDDIKQIFDRITYGKGASIIRMMYHFLTEATFRKGLRNYLIALQFNNAEQDDLWKFLTAAAHEDQTLPLDITVKMVMDTWTLQMGYPVIKVVRDQAGTTASVTQEHFLLARKGNQSKSRQSPLRWWVPLTYTDQDNANFGYTQARLWMSDSQTHLNMSFFPSRDQWVIFNVQQSGYYRVNYDDHNWNLLILQLLADHTPIHALNRAQIIDDAFNLARAGQLSYDVALRVNAYLRKETEYVPWAAALTSLDYLDNMLRRSPGYGHLKNFMRDLLVPLYDSVGFVDNLDDPHLEQLKRVKALSWACKLHYKDCVDNSVLLYSQWMLDQTNHSIISPNLRTTVYCTAIAAGGQKEWDFAWGQLLASTVRSQREKLLDGLGCTKRIWILSQYLEKAFDEESGISKREALRAFTSVAKNDMGRHLAWDFLRSHCNRIRKRYSSGSTLGRFINVATKSLNTPLELKELHKFLADNKVNLEPASRAVDRALETVTNNVDWLGTNHGLIVEWLQRQGYSDSSFP
ncbi:aminopeptidase Ey-like [Panulirus ornatus]|uniref:aminopeptidase Ey-like n=1 Tax=Panulirus ornatus TaxID=150431 RepID=UPI003A84E095